MTLKCSTLRRRLKSFSGSPRKPNGCFVWGTKTKGDRKNSRAIASGGGAPSSKISSKQQLEAVELLHPVVRKVGDPDVGARDGDPARGRELAVVGAVGA